MASPFLKVTGGPGEGTVYPLSGSVVLGRGHDADIVLSDAGVSRVHAHVRAEGETVVVEDAESSNGTWVNSERIETPTRLREGDELQLGDVVFAVHVGTGEYDASDDRPTPTEQTAVHPGPDA